MLRRCLAFPLAATALLTATACGGPTDPGDGDTESDLAATSDALTGKTWTPLVDFTRTIHDGATRSTTTIKLPFVFDYPRADAGPSSAAETSGDRGTSTWTLHGVLAIRKNGTFTVSGSGSETGRLPFYFHSQLDYEDHCGKSPTKTEIEACPVRNHEYGIVRNIDGPLYFYQGYDENADWQRALTEPLPGFEPERANTGFSVHVLDGGDFLVTQTDSKGNVLHQTSRISNCTRHGACQQTCRHTGAPCPSDVVSFWGGGKGTDGFVTVAAKKMDGRANAHAGSYNEARHVKVIEAGD